jgi:hypothetical protein
LQEWCFEQNISFAFVQYLLGFVPCVVLVAFGVGIAKGSNAPARSTHGKSPTNYMRKLLAGGLSPQLALFGYYLPFCAIAIFTGRYAKVSATGGRSVDITVALLLSMLIIFQIVMVWGVWKCVEKSVKGNRIGWIRIALISSVFAVIASWFMWT